MRFSDFESAVKDCKTAEEMKNAVDNLNSRYQKNIMPEGEDGESVAAAYFETDNVSSRELGHVFVYAEPADDANELLDETGHVIAREETELMLSVFENYTDSASDDYLYTYTIYENGERVF